MSEAPQTNAFQRIDVWLWYARFAKTRSLAQALIARGKVRINRVRITKSSHLVRTDDVITISLGPRIRVISVKAFAKRRGPATEAALLFEELTPKQDHPTSGADAPSVEIASKAAAINQGERQPGAGRPTKRDRRRLDRWKQGIDTN